MTLAVHLVTICEQGTLRLLLLLLDNAHPSTLDDGQPTICTCACFDSQKCIIMWWCAKLWILCFAADDKMDTGDVTCTASSVKQVSVDVQKCCSDILNNVLVDLSRYVHSKCGDSSVGIPFLTSLQEHVDSLCRLLFESNGQRSVWLFCLSCLSMKHAHRCINENKSQQWIPYMSIRLCFVVFLLGHCRRDTLSRVLKYVAISSNESVASHVLAQAMRHASNPQQVLLGTLNGGCTCRFLYGVNLVLYCEILLVQS